MQSQRGFTLIEVLIGGALLLFLGVAGINTFSLGTQSERAVAVEDQMSEVDSVLKGAVLKAIWTYFDSALPACNTTVTPFSPALSGLLAPEITAAPLDPATIDAQLPASALGGDGLAAKERCRTNQTPYMVPNFSTQNAFYFCLLLTAPAGAITGRGSLLSGPSAFAEFSFSLESITSGSVVTCQTYPSVGVNGALATLVYALYWTSQDSSGLTSHHHMASVSRGHP